MVGFISLVSFFLMSIAASSGTPSMIKFTAVDSFNSPLKARIFVDGKRVGDTPEKVSLPPGVNTILLTHVGYKNESFTVEAIEGEHKEIEKKMTPTEKKDWPYTFLPGLLKNMKTLITII